MIRDFMGMPLKRCAVEAVTWLLGVSLQCLLIADAQARGSVAVDREALEALYHATGGPDWRNSANWLSAMPLGEWFGVDTDSNGRVTSLSLTSNGLSGAMPPELAALTNLQELYLWGNELSGEIPPELADLTNLQVLWLGHNELIGEIPPELAVLTNLQELYLGLNELSGAIPPELADLTNLQVLDLGSNDLIGTIPPELGGLTDLQELYLWGNDLIGTIPAELAVLTNLQVLELGGNDLSGAIPPELAALTNLRLLRLESNELMGAIPPELGGLTNLQELYLGGNQLNGKIPWELMQLSELTKFDISHTDVCVPTGDDFQAWLGTISDFRSSGLACDGSLRVAFSASNYVVREGGSVEVTVRLIDQTEGPAPSATIALTVTPGGGATGHDYAGVPERVTITAPASAGTFRVSELVAMLLSGTAPASAGTFLVTAVEDYHYDHAETITLGFRRPLPSGVTAGSPDTATVTIIDPGTVLMTDREVLEALYEASGGPDWSDRTNWLSGAPLGEWFGVDTDSNGRVTSLALPGNGLSGGIPPALGRLASLERLDLRARWDPSAGQWVGNELSGAIPPELGDLTNLQELYLRGNELSGAIPPELADLTNLQELDLGGNELSGEIPPALGRLDSLERLDLGARWHSSSSLYVRGNDLSGAIPPELGDLTNLQVLSLGRNDLSGLIPPELGDLTNLQELDLGGNDLSGLIPPELGDLTNLQELDLGVNELSGEIPPELGDLTNLQGLYLRLNELSGLIPPELGDLTKLQVLNLWVNDLSGEIPPELADLTNLRVLDLGGNDLSGAIPPELGALTNLQVLFLWGNELSGEIPPELADLTNLEVLRLGVNELSGEIPPELGDLTKLQVLSLGSNDLKGEIPPELGALTNLRWLNLGGNELSGAIPPELGDLTNLQELSLVSNELSGEIPPELGALTNLQYLTLWGNELSGEIPPELGDLTNLIGLRIGFNPNLTGTIPRQLLQLTLPVLNLMATAVCVPLDEEFQEWLATINIFTPSGAICGRLPEAMTSIDVAVFYTPAARRLAGGTAEIEAEIDLLVAETNQAYEDSGVNQGIVLAAAEEVPYEEENASGLLAVDRLAEERDGYMDEVHAIRERVGADLVHLIAEVTDVGGAALLAGAFGLTGATGGAGVFAHELGHNMGLSHDRYVDHGRLAYSYGYVNQRAFVDGAPESSRWSTIMAYPNQCSDAGFGCDWILRFSNPNQSYLGRPAGRARREPDVGRDRSGRCGRARSTSRGIPWRPSAPGRRTPSPELCQGASRQRGPRPYPGCGAAACSRRSRRRSTASPSPIPRRCGVARSPSTSGNWRKCPPTGPRPCR